jgi:magnesium chelatase family protein
MNPCRCGFAGDVERRCTCPPGESERYVRRVSGPLLDRLDVQVELRRVPAGELVTGPAPEASSAVAGRIAAARVRARSRNGGRLNAELSGREIVALAGAEPAAMRLLAELAERGTWSARGTHRVLRMARTIADLSGAPVVDAPTILSAAGLRDPRERLAA